MGANKHQIVVRLNLAPPMTIPSTQACLLLPICAVGGPDYVQIRGPHEQAQLLMY